MKKEALYEDRLIKIKDDSLVIKNYYLPFVSKVVSFKNIETIETIEPTFINTTLVFPLFLWSLFGFGIIEHHITYFPFDLFRASRDEIFIVTYKNQKIRTGFSVQDSKFVEGILKEKEWLQKIFD